MIYTDTEFRVDLQRFAEAGTLVNATPGYTNAYTGAVTEFSGKYDLSAGMKSFYDTALLDFAREQFIYQQLGETQTLPEGSGMVVEWRKINTLPDVAQLQEAVIPEGLKLGESSINVEIAQYGAYVTISDVINTHHVDPLLTAATERLGYAWGVTYEKLIRNELMLCTNVMYAEVLDDEGNVESIPQTRQELLNAINAGKSANLTPRVVAKAANTLVKANAPKYSGNEYLAVINPSQSFDLRMSDDWVEAHKYASPTEIYNGEIGKLHGVRFMETTLSPVVKDSGATNAIYMPMFFGKGAFSVVDPVGAGMRMIHKSFADVGGPLEQFCTVGVKGSMATKILYPERMLVVECGSTTYSETDEDNSKLQTEQV